MYLAEAGSEKNDRHWWSTRLPMHRCTELGNVRERRVSFVRIMVVDDFEPWRRVLSETIETRPGWRVVGEAAEKYFTPPRALGIEVPS